MKEGFDDALQTAKNERLGKIIAEWSFFCNNGKLSGN
jgi:hypothetical protein